MKRLTKKIAIIIMVIIFTFQFSIFMPYKKAHAILPAIIAGQVIKKVGGRALAGVLTRQGAKTATVVTMEKAVKMFGSRMTPAQYKSFTEAIAKGTKSLDNKWIKIAIGAELSLALVGIGDELDKALNGEDINERMARVGYNEELRTPDKLAPDGTILEEGIPFAEVWANANNQMPVKPEYLEFFQPTANLIFPGLEVTAKLNVGAQYPFIGATSPSFYAGSGEPTMGGDMGVHRGAYFYRTYPTSGYITNRKEIQWNDVAYIKGIRVNQPAAGEQQRVDVTIVLEIGPQKWSSTPTLNSEGYATIITSMDKGEWQAYLNDYLIGESFIAEDYLANYTYNPNWTDIPIPESQGAQAFQIPNPEYWQDQNAYMEQLLSDPEGTTIIDPNNYPDGDAVPPYDGEPPIGGGGDKEGEPKKPTKKILFDPLLMNGDLLKEKFPFSIPWDFIKQISVFNVQPEAPIWNIDIPEFLKLGEVTVPFKMRLDFAMFDPIANILRWGNIIVFDIGLIFMIRRFLPE